MTEQLRLFIAIPSMNTWEADFGMSLAQLVATLSHPFEGYGQGRFQLWNKKSSILANSRQGLVETALKSGATHLLFLDSDQTFPSDLAHRLMKHRKPVVACNIATKMLPSSPTARHYNPETTAGAPVYTTPDSPELEEVWRVGTGIMLIDLGIFENEALQGHLFDQHWNEELDSYVGEDWAFCEKLQDAGIPIHVDHHTSLAVGHVGKLNYGHDLVEIKDGVGDSVSAESILPARDVG